MAGLTFFEMMSGYNKVGDKDDGKKFISSTVSGSFAGRLNSRPINIILSATARLKSLLAYTSTRCYGLFLISFGLLMLIIHFVKSYLGMGYDAPLGILIVGAASAMLGVLTVVYDKPLAIVLQDFPVTDFVLFEFFCIKRIHRRTGERGLPSFIGLILGIVLASITWVVPAEIVFFAVVGIVYLYAVMLSPEFSLFSTFLILPYLSLLDNHEIILSVFIGFNVLSFARKVMLGRRVLYIEQYDICIFVFLLFVLISGIFVKGMESFTSSLVMIVLASGYFLSGCIVANRRLADCLINALIISSVPVSILSIVQFVLFINENPFSEFSGVSATFSSPEILAVFLISALIFTAYYIKTAASGAVTALYSIIAFITLGALALTYNFWAIIISIMAFAVYFMSRNVKLLSISVISFAFITSVPALISRELIERVSKIELLAPLGLESFAERWETARRMLMSNFFTGIGIGKDCYLEELEKMSETAYFADSGSFFLEIAVEAGVFALAALLVVFIIRIRHRFVYVNYVRNSQLSTLSKFTSIATAALVALGAFNYLWSDMSMYFLFWCIFGVGSATLRISRQEHDERVGYYSDGRSADSSSIDLDI